VADQLDREVGIILDRDTRQVRGQFYTSVDRTSYTYGVRDTRHGLKPMRIARPKVQHKAIERG
jgi:hypothetical protein